MTERVQDQPVPMHDLLDLLRRTRSVAVVGVSANPARASYGVTAYLIERTGWTVHLVNPTIDGELFGRTVYPDLTSLPEVPDLVDVFRRPPDIPPVADEAVAVGARSLWLQLGLRHDEAAAKAHAAGLEVVQDRCLKVDHAQYASLL